MNCLFKTGGILLLGMLLSTGAAAPQQGNGTLPRKKIIQCGWDQRTPAQLPATWQELEKKLPFDGLILDFHPRDSKGKKLGSTSRIWQRGKWAEDVFARDIACMKKCKFTKFKHNFILTGATGNKSEIANWFDDSFWSDVAHNMRLTARAARESGCKGLIFDAEAYSKFRWRYRADSGRSFQETALKARQRGREIMKAVKSEFRNCTILFYWFLTMSGLSMPETFHKAAYGLYPAFINGLVDELPPEMTLIDGCENGYWYKNKSNFLSSYQQIRSGTNPAIAPENRKKFRQQVLAGFGIYLDSHFLRNGYSVPPVNGSQIRALRYQLTAAVQAADEYVWVYGERKTWFSDEESRSWESTLPGITRTIELSRSPESIVKELPGALKEGKVKNQAKNPGFISGTPGKVKSKDYLGLTPSKVPGFVKFGGGKALIDTSTGYNSSTSVVMTGNILLLQSHNVKEGESYYIRVRSKSEGKAEPKLSVAWQTSSSTWCAQDHGRSCLLPKGGSRQWQSLSLFTQVPAGAGKMVVSLNRIGGGTADRVWYDELEIYKLDDLFEAPETFNAMMKALRLQNKARNGDFKTSASAGKIVPVRNFPSYWHVSGKQAVPGVCAIDGTDGFKSSQSAKLTGMKKPTSVCQYISVKPGEKYRLSIYAKKCGKGNISFKAGWMKNWKWTAAKHTASAKFTPVPGSRWLQAVIPCVTVPAGANKLIPIATVSGQESVDDAVWFDKLEVRNAD